MTQKLAQSMVVDHRRGVVEIDGAEFPWHVHEDGPKITSYDLACDWTLVELPVIVDRNNVTVITTLEQDLQEIRDLGASELEAARQWFMARCGVKVFQTARIRSMVRLPDGSFSIGIEADTR